MEPKKLGRPTDQRLAVLRNQASELLWYGKIETTVDRAKSVRSIAEKLITLAINTYEDTVKVTKTKTNLKGEKVEVEFTNDGPKKLAARRKMIAELRDIPEAKEEKESKTAYAKRTADVSNPLVENSSTNMLPNTQTRGRERSEGRLHPHRQTWRTSRRRSIHVHSGIAVIFKTKARRNACFFMQNY